MTVSILNDSRGREELRSNPDDLLNYLYYYSYFRARPLSSVHIAKLGYFWSRERE